MGRKGFLVEGGPDDGYDLFGVRHPADEPKFRLPVISDILRRNSEVLAVAKGSQRLQSRGPSFRSHSQVYV